MFEKIAYRTANVLRNAAQALWPEEEAPDFLRDFRLLDTHRVGRVNRVNGRPMESLGTIGNLAHWAAEVSGSRYVVLLAGPDGRVTVGLADPAPGGVIACWTRIDEVRPAGILIEFTELKLV